jgi:hypothetical protein
MRKFLINISYIVLDGTRGDLYYIEADTLQQALSEIENTGIKVDHYTFMEITQPLQVISRKLY